jgi:lysophospholipase L1-like esterase
MSLWGKNNNANNAPKFTTSVNTGFTGIQDFGNTVFFTNGNDGFNTPPGWVKKTVGTGGRAGRIFYESLIALPTVYTKPLLPFGSVLVAAGDSITNNGFAVNSSSAIEVTRGFVPWGVNLSRQLLSLPNNANAGVAGNTTTQLLARYDTDVIAKNPKVVSIHIGTNDVTTAVDSASVTSVISTAISNISAMIVKNRAIGAFTFLFKIFPRGTLSNTVTPTQMTSFQIAAWEGINAWILTQAASDIKIVDVEPYVGNMDSQHTMKTGYDTADNLHPSATGAFWAGYAFAQAITSSVTSGDILFQSNTDPLNLVTGGFMTGTTGTFNVSGDSIATGSVAAGWIGDGSVSGGATVTLQKVARTDGFGEWQQMTLGGTYTGTTKYARVRKSQTITGNIGDVVQGFCEVEVDAGLQAIKEISLTFSNTFNLITNQPYLQQPQPNGPWKAVFRTLPFTLTASASSVAIYCTVGMLDTATTDPVSAVVRWGRVGFKKL